MAAACGGGEGGNDGEGGADSTANATSAAATGGTTAGAGSTTGGTSGTTGGGTGGNGITACGNFPDQQPKSCQAGQYCADEGFSECLNGCLSNVNCTSDQSCIKEAGQNVGTCQTVQGSVPCDTVCSKLKACAPATTDEMCDQFCAGTNDACKTCVANANCTDADACTAECGL